MLTARSGLLTADQDRDDLAHDSVRPRSPSRPRSGATCRTLPTPPRNFISLRAPGSPGAAAPISMPKTRSTGFGSTSSSASRPRAPSRSTISASLFHGAPSTGPALKTYTFDDVVNALNQIAPYDWRGFWTERLTNHGPGAPLGGIEGSGWKVVYDETPSEMMSSSAGAYHFVPAAFAIGLVCTTMAPSPTPSKASFAAKAGIGPGMKLVAVNGRRFSPEILRDAIKAAKTGTAPIELLVENTDYYKTYKIDYHGGEKYPHLVRDESKPDLLTRNPESKIGGQTRPFRCRVERSIEYSTG